MGAPPSSGSGGARLEGWGTHRRSEDLLARPDIRPKKGDIYLLKQTAKKDAMFAHVGLIMDSSGTAWKTADAGQGKGFAVGFRRRTFDPATAKIQGEEGVLQYFKGWVDLEGLLE